jgi:adenosylhomocysteine nucleosidase
VANGQVELDRQLSKAERGTGLVALLAAMREEIVGVQHRIVLEEPPGRDGRRLFKGKYRNRDVILMQTGLGREKAEDATRFVLEHYPVSALVYFGFAGALSPELKPGDLILCRELQCADNLTAGDACFSDHDLLSCAIQAMGGQEGRSLLGSSVTVDRLVAEPEEKRKLGEAYGARVVDMEDYWVARVASARRTPFLAIRAVLDTLMDRLPPFVRFMNLDGRWLMKEASLHFMTHPRQLASLPRIVVNTRQATKSLTSCLETLVPNL